MPIVQESPLGRLEPVYQVRSSVWPFDNVVLSQIDIGNSFVCLGRKIREQVCSETGLCRSFRPTQDGGMSHCTPRYRMTFDENEKKAQISQVM
jgi:hypothetical protein